jgi:DNA repair photolyase
MTKAPIIYEPQGRAREYAPLACNLAVGCVHGCTYCYGPGQFRRDPAAWGEVRPKADALARFERDAARLAGDPREILFSFATDPCGTPAQVEMLERALPIAECFGLSITVLTKNPKALLPLASMFRRNDWRIGTTVCFLDERLREQWEPGAPPIQDRLEALSVARREGVRTWASVEPVVDADGALNAIEVLRDHVGEIRVGHWNHCTRAKEIDWQRFLHIAREILGEHPYLFKADLLRAAGEGA